MNLSQPPQSASEPYRLELERGFSKLRFSPPIEREYRAHLSKSHYRAALVCALMGSTIWFIFIIYDFIRINTLGDNAFDDIRVKAWVACRFSTMAVFLYVIYRVRSTFKNYHRYVFFAFVSCSFGSAFCAAMISMKNLPSSYHFEAIVIMAAFLPFGLTFFQALAAAVLAVAISITSYSLVNWDSGIELIIRYSIPLLCAIPVGGIGGYLREHAEREQFLYRSMFSHQATVDPLTGIANRRLFEEHTTQKLKLANSTNKQVVVALVDIDFFKQFNDTYGHDAGDHAIRLVANHLKEQINRSSDMVARMGGEEFGVFLYNTDEEEARRKLQRVIDDIYSAKLLHRASHLGFLSISIGMTIAKEHEAMQTLLKRADMALYSAKSEGRNRLKLAGDNEEELLTIANIGHA